MFELATFIVALMLDLNVHENQGKDSILTVFWNLENFFDYTDQGTGESDRDFSSTGSRHWTKRRFMTKCDMVAKSILWIGDRYGRMPDVIGFAEVENKRVLKYLLDYSILRKSDYGIIHHESGDRRGIDVALIYRKSKFEHICTSLKAPCQDGNKIPTRDILHVCLKDSGGHHIDFIVNHHPSKYGGSGESEKRRIAAMKALTELCDSLDSENIIAMGDFNDTPDADSFDMIKDKLVNKAIPLHQAGEGTIRYEGKWELIDMFLVGEELDSLTDMNICRIPFLMTWDKKHPGYKPFRTYAGPRYIGGVSDHCPIVLKIYLCRN